MALGPGGSGGVLWGPGVSWVSWEAWWAFGGVALFPGPEPGASGFTRPGRWAQGCPTGVSSLLGPELGASGLCWPGPRARWVLGGLVCSLGSLGSVLVGGLAAGALWVPGVPVGVLGFCGGSWGRLRGLVWGLGVVRLGLFVTVSSRPGHWPAELAAVVPPLPPPPLPRLLSSLSAINSFWPDWCRRAFRLLTRTLGKCLGRWR